MRFIFLPLCLISFFRLNAQKESQIPVLCYHNIKKYPAHEDQLTISEANLDSQFRELYINGYHTISPLQLYNRYTYDSAIPSKPVLITFDDTHEEHYSIAKPLLEKYGFKGVFFIMTICIDKPGCLTSSQIKELSNEGHTIGAHTWDHPNLAKKDSINLKWEIGNPIQQLENITGKKIETFAYPYGAWNDKVVEGLKKYGVKTAFQLTGKKSNKEPIMTLNRIMVSGKWSGTQLQKKIDLNFSTEKELAKYQFFLSAIFTLLTFSPVTAFVSD